MIEFVFTIDYEIYGNGTGSLNDLVYEPTRRLKELFLKHDARLVAFVEVAELAKIEAFATDAAIDRVKEQVHELYRDDFEIALHLHPQWSNARYVDGRWALDLAEYNLCTLSPARVTEIVGQSVSYLRHLVGEPSFVPLSFRAGNWLFQPTRTAARALAEAGLRIDSSVFKGGLQRNHGLDYRAALSHGDYWRFSDNVTVSDASGSWIELPIHTEMVPSWQMATAKRVGSGNAFGVSGGSIRRKIVRGLDFMRFRYPRKLDFCRMTLSELTAMVERVVHQDRQSPETLRPIVAIGHSKDPFDLAAIDSFLSYLRSRQIRISTFADLYPKLRGTPGFASHSALATSAAVAVAG